MPDTRDDDAENDRPRRRYDDDDDDRRPRRRRRMDDNFEEYGPDGGMSTLIPYKNGMALASYYTGVFGLIPCAGLVLGPIALTFGFLGLRAAKREPRVKGTGHAITGIVLGLLTTLGHWGVVGFAIIRAATK